MTLADIMARGVQVEWHEALALLRAVLDAGVAASDRIPGFDEVELVATGHVEVHGGELYDAPVERLVFIFRALLGSQAPPGMLNELLVTPPGSLRDFSQSLEYFERPVRADILAHLYRRATDTSPLPDADALIASLRATALKSPEDASLRTTPVVDSRKRYYVAGVVGLTAAIAALLLFTAWRWREGTSIAGASSVVGNKVAGGIAAVAGVLENAINPTSHRVAGGPAQNPPPPIEAGDPRGSTAKATRRGSDQQIVKHPAPTPPYLGSPTVAPTPNEHVSAIDRMSPALPSQLETYVIFASEAASELIYSSASLDVVGPVAVRPQLPKDTSLSLSAEGLTRIEMVISADGTVASAKLLDSPRTIHDSMLLSAAKAWRFHPALKNGIPVAYRTTISVAR